MKFTLVTTCFNEIGSFSKWKTDVINQTRQPDEICIVDSESTDGTRECLQEWAKNDLRVKIKIEKCSVARGRNLAIAMAKYEHIVSTDMGVRIDKRWFEEIVRPMEEYPKYEVVAGASAIDKSSAITPAAKAEYYLEDGGLSSLKPGFVVGNRSVLYKKYVWSQLGGLPEDLTMCADDSVFGRQINQAGYKMAYAPKAIVYWQRHKALRDFWREHYNYGFGSGEASIMMPFAYRLHLKGWLPKFFVPFLTACRDFQKHISYRAIKNAIIKRDFTAVAYIFPLLFGRGYCYGKGYVQGYAKGTQNCSQCRSRLKNQS